MSLTAVTSAVTVMAAGKWQLYDFLVKESRNWDDIQDGMLQVHSEFKKQTEEGQKQCISGGIKFGKKMREIVDGEA